MTEGTVMSSSAPQKVVGVSKGDQRKTVRQTRCLKTFVVLILLSSSTYVIVDSATEPRVENGIVSFLEWVETEPIMGIFFFIGVYSFVTLFFIPGAILCLGAGFVFAHNFGLGMGLLLGTTPCFVGACCGGTVNFLLARYLLRDWVQTTLRKYAIFEALEICMADNTKAFRVMSLMHLSPVVPFTVLNYVAGITSVSFPSFVLSLVFVLPGSFLYVFLGASAGSLVESIRNGTGINKVTIAIVFFGMVSAIAGVCLTNSFTRTEVNQIIEARKADLDRDSRNHSGLAVVVEAA